MGASRAVSSGFSPEASGGRVRRTIHYLREIPAHFSSPVRLFRDHATKSANFEVLSFIWVLRIGKSGVYRIFSFSTSKILDHWKTTHQPNKSDKNPAREECRGASKPFVPRVPPDPTVPTEERCRRCRVTPVQDRELKS